MIDVNKNEKLNQKLRTLYCDATNKFLEEYEKAFGDKAPGINTFGIADEESYDEDNGILVILKETNGWNDKDFQEKTTYIDFVYDVIKKGSSINDGREAAERVTMNMWYNLGRWITAIKEPDKEPKEIAEMHDEAIKALGAAAYTNVNKVRGYARSDKEFWEIAKSEIAINTIKEEIKILNPKTIIFGGTLWIFENSYINELRQKGIKVLDMWHPAARKSNVEMIEEVQKQMQEG